MRKRSRIALAAALVLLALFAVVLWTPDRARADLEAQYAGAPSQFIEVAGIRLHVRDTGPRTAPAVVLLHGLGSSLHTWEPWAQSLKDFRVVRFDLPGFGLTGADPTGDYSDDRAMRILLSLLDRLGIERADIVGHSMGGRIAWKFAATYPQRVNKLVLISPDGFASPGFEYGKKPQIPLLANLMTVVLPKYLLRINLLPGYANPAAASDALVTRYYDLIRAPGVRQAILDRTEQTVLEDPLPVLRTIRAPTLLLWGQQDAMIPFKNSQDYLRAIPGSTLAPLPALGHLPFEEAPAASLQPVLAFLSP